MQVLVAEDNATNHLVIRKLLENWGATVNLAVNGAEAITQFETTSHDVDIIFMDCEMPEVDGYQATQQIRMLDEKTPIVALTAHALPEFKDHAMAVGMSDYVTKPINRATLLEAILAQTSAPVGVQEGAPHSP